MLNLTLIPVLLIGHGELLSRRLRFLREAGATRVVVIDISPPLEGGVGGGVGPNGNIAPVAPPSLTLPLKGGGDTIVMIAGLSREEAEPLAVAARAAGKLVNVEDMNDLCDFYFTANLRRGDLVIAVSTAGASPTLARKIRDRIGEMFGEEWGARVAEMGAVRKGWLASGARFGELVAKAERFLEEKGWLTVYPERQRSNAKMESKDPVLFSQEDPSNRLRLPQDKVTEAA